MYRFGVIYIIFGDIVFSFVALVINTFYTKIFVNYGLVEQIKDVSMMIGISSVLSIIGLTYIDEISNDYLKILTGILFVGGFYLMGMYYLNKKLFLDNVYIIKSKFLK